MAHKEDMRDSTDKYTVFTLNGSKIGRNGENRMRSDIQLVQFFLRQFFKRHPELFALLPKTKSGAGEVKIDGVYGKQTEAAIKVFQKHKRANGSPIVADGLVSVARSTRTPVTKSMYTILWLNKSFADFGEGKEHVENLENHPDIVAYAPELRQELLSGSVHNDFAG